MEGNGEYSNGYEAASEVVYNQPQSSNSEKQPLIGPTGKSSYSGGPGPGAYPQQQQSLASEYHVPPIHVHQPSLQQGNVQSEYGVLAVVGQNEIMVKPQAIPGCPPGLEYLTQIDQLLVHQLVQLIEVFTMFEPETKFMVKNSQGQEVFFATEESDCCGRQCCGPQRDFVIHITDNYGNEVIQLKRDFMCCAGPLCPCLAGCDACAQEVVVESPPGTIIGKVKQQYSWPCCTGWRFKILDAYDEEIFDIQGPKCLCQFVCCPDDLQFMVLNKKGEEIGILSKQYGGLWKEAFTTADNFGITFPMDLDVKLKAVMLGAVFLIDFMFFERRKNNKK